MDIIVKRAVDRCKYTKKSLGLLPFVYFFKKNMNY